MKEEGRSSDRTRVGRVKEGGFFNTERLKFPWSDQRNRNPFEDESGQYGVPHTQTSISIPRQTGRDLSLCLAKAFLLDEQIKAKL